jgi:hypothetical protein
VETHWTNFQSSKRTEPRAAVATRSSPLQVEVLEDRTLLSTFFVDNAADYVITNDQGTTGLDAGDTVTWDSSATHSAGPVAGLIFGIDAFTSIQSAVNATTANGVSADTINVAAGTFMENVTINTNVNLIGTTGMIVDGNQAGSVFTIGAFIVTFESLTIHTHRPSRQPLVVAVPLPKTPPPGNRPGLEAFLERQARLGRAGGFWGRLLRASTQADTISLASRFSERSRSSGKSRSQRVN